MKTVIVGKSARGKTRLLLGSYYSISLRGWDINEIEPMLPARVPPELAWSEMNKSWSHKRK